MALNPNAFVDGVMDGFSLHIEPPSYIGFTVDICLFVCFCVQVNNFPVMLRQVFLG